MRMMLVVWTVIAVDRAVCKRWWPHQPKTDEKEKLPKKTQWHLQRPKSHFRKRLPPVSAMSPAKVVVVGGWLAGWLAGWVCWDVVCGEERGR